MRLSSSGVLFTSFGHIVGSVGSRERSQNMKAIFRHCDRRTDARTVQRRGRWERSGKRLELPAQIDGRSIDGASVIVVRPLVFVANAVSSGSSLTMTDLNNMKSFYGRGKPHLESQRN